MAKDNQINFYAEKADTETSIGKVSNAKDIQVKSAKDYLKTNDSVENGKSRNKILNGGKQLTLMTVRSSVMSNSCDLIMDNLEENTEPSNAEEDEYLTF